jgi:hypothetical protein
VCVCVYVYPYIYIMCIVTVEVLPLLNDQFWMQLGVCAADKVKILSALPPHLQVTFF